MDSISATEMALRLGAAMVCGAVVGLERERKHRPVGLRTMILISIGSCGYMLIALEVLSLLSTQAGAAAAVGTDGSSIPVHPDISRVLQGLVTGIGFIGAGSIIQNRKTVKGLTTAAAAWVVAGLGAACGLGLYKLAAVLTGVVLFTLVVLAVVEQRVFPEPPKEPEPPERSEESKDRGEA